MLALDEIVGRAMNDLRRKAGWPLDPGRDIDEVVDVPFRDGRVAGDGPDRPQSCARGLRDVRDRLVVPGLIDRHANVGRGGTSIAALAPAHPGTDSAAGTPR